MIDCIVILQDRAVIIYTNRPPVVLTPEGDVRSFVRWILTPKVTTTYAEFSRAVSIENEDTQEIEIEKVG